jgi:hypothetical protein
MSYTPEFAPDARSQWRQLDFEFQEVVLDIMDFFTSTPPMGDTDRAERVVDSNGIRHSIIVRVAIDHRRKLVALIGVSHKTRPISP